VSQNVTYAATLMVLSMQQAGLLMLLCQQHNCTVASTAVAACHAVCFSPITVLLMPGVLICYSCLLEHVRIYINC